MADLPANSSSTSWTTIFSVLIITAVASLIYRIVYNLYLHPLAHVPGPKLAAATYLYQTYYGLSGSQSRYYLKIDEMHKKYGDTLLVSIMMRLVMLTLPRSCSQSHT